MLRFRPTKNAIAQFSKIQITVMLLGLFSLIFTAAPVAVRVAAATVQNQVVVQLITGVNISDINKSYNTTTIFQISTDDNSYLLSTPAGQDPNQIVASMATDTRLVNAEINSLAAADATADARFYSDPSSALANGSSSPDAIALAQNQWALSQIRASQAKGVSTGSNIVVAVVDSGVNVNHPELSGKILAGKNIIDNNLDVSDTNGHGTFIAGLILQIAPNAKILPVKVIAADGTADLADIVTGIRWAADNGAKIINLSLGMYSSSKTLNDAIGYAASKKGALVLGSAGNNNTSMKRYPASSTNAFSVAALTSQNRKADFSNYNDNVDVAAPGVNIYSTYYKGGYAYGNGTSFSTPIVAATAALVWAKTPSLKFGDVINAINRAAIPVDNCNANTSYSNKLGKGLVDAYSALGGSARSDLGLMNCSEFTVYGIAARPPDADGFYNHPVQVDFTAMGGRPIARCDSFLVSGPETDHGSITGTCTDVYGTVGLGIFKFEYDSIKPTITPKSPSIVLLGNTVKADFSCDDGGSHIFSCSGSSLNYDTSTVGAKTFTITATDKANNSFSQQIPYTVTYKTIAAYDQSLAIKRGRQVAIKVQLTDASDTNMASIYTTVTAKKLTGPDGKDVSLLESVKDFSLGRTTYTYNLQTLTTYLAGTYTLSFSINGDPLQHTVTFVLTT